MFSTAEVFTRTAGFGEELLFKEKLVLSVCCILPEVSSTNNDTLSFSTVCTVFVITSVLFSVTTFFPLLLSHALRARTNATSNKQGKRKTLHVSLISIHNIKFIANMGFLFTTQVSLLFFKFYFRSITLYSNVNTDNEKGRAVCLLTSVVSSFSMPLPILTLFS